MLGEIENKSNQLTKAERFSAIGELATMVAHDLRNPLQGIQNAAFFLKRSPSAGPKEKEMLTLIEDDVKYSDKIVNDLLDYSRNIRLETTETNPQKLIRESLALTTIPKGVEVIDETQDMPQLSVDVDKVKRVFINVMNNAIDAMPNGGLLVLQTKATDHIVEFMVIDSGVGMSKEVMDRIFTPLYTTKARGMGFGLSICKRIVEAHGGRITVKSTPGKGTSFIISLPAETIPKGGENS
jgi:signal transduction histidine kinase